MVNMHMNILHEVLKILVYILNLFKNKVTRGNLHPKP